jgi:hypothetical protein
MGHLDDELGVALVYARGEVLADVLYVDGFVICHVERNTYPFHAQFVRFAVECSGDIHGGIWCNRRDVKGVLRCPVTSRAQEGEKPKCGVQSYAQPPHNALIDGARNPDAPIAPLVEFLGALNDEDAPLFLEQPGYGLPRKAGHSGDLGDRVRRIIGGLHTPHQRRRQPDKWR